MLRQARQSEGQIEVGWKGGGVGERGKHSQVIGKLCLLRIGNLPLFPQSGDRKIRLFLEGSRGCRFREGADYGASFQQALPGSARALCSTMYSLDIKSHLSRLTLSPTIPKSPRELKVTVPDHWPICLRAYDVLYWTLLIHFTQLTVPLTQHQCLWTRGGLASPFIALRQTTNNILA